MSGEQAGYILSGSDSPLGGRGAGALAHPARKIGLFLINRGHAYQEMMARDAEEAARRQAVDLEIVFSEAFAAQQAQDIMRFVHANPDRQLGVVVMTVSDRSTDEASVSADPIYKLARRVAARGAGWIALNREADGQVRALRREFPALPIGLVTPDQKELGRIQGSQFKALLPRGGRVLYVLGNPLFSSVHDRRAGMLEAIAGSSLKVDEVDGLWSREKAGDAVYRWLISPHRRPEDWPELIGCQNDEMALGAWQALCRAANSLNDQRLREVPVTGLDGVAGNGQRWVTEGKLAATIAVPSTSGRAIDLLVQTWASGRATPLKTVEHPSSFPPLGSLRPVARRWQAAR
jgi:ABC-type sugar transport system substrate-binding protein